MQLDDILRTDYARKCFIKLQVVGDYYDEDMDKELSSFFDSDYSDNLSVNYAIAIKALLNVIQFHISKLRKMKEVETPDAMFEKSVAIAIGAFDEEREEAFNQAYHRLKDVREFKKSKRS